MFVELVGGRIQECKKNKKRCVLCFYGMLCTLVIVLIITKNLYDRKLILISLGTN